jgi:thymidylate synthase ThyX
MSVFVRIIKDSVSPHGVRLTSYELTYPRLFHSELMTYRAFSRNASSSRAIPVSKIIERIEKDPAMPVYWGKTQKGMQSVEELSIKGIDECKAEWLEARDNAIKSAKKLLNLGLHKQVVNRLLEPFMHMVTLVTATDFANMFAQRNHPDAQPEFQLLARIWWEVHNTSSKIDLVDYGQWHLPYIQFDDEIEVAPLPEKERIYKLKAISSGRCARTSYVNQEGKRSLEDDVGLHDRLKSSNPGHWSPFEHVATPDPNNRQCANFKGWVQYRKEFASENITVPPKWDPTFKPCHGCLSDVKPGSLSVYCSKCLDAMPLDLGPMFEL